MRNIKFGRILIVSLLSALSLTALMAVSAQAGFFILNSKGEKVILLATIGGTGGAGYLLVLEKNLKLNCTSGEVEPENTTTHKKSEIIELNLALAVVKFEGCTALNDKTNGELPCTVAPVLATTLAKPYLFDDKEKSPGVLFEPDEGSNFTVVKMSGELCPLPPENPVTGQAVALVDYLPAGATDAVEPLLLFSDAIQLLAKESSGDILKFGVSESIINATVHVKLTGEHIGLKFGVV